MAQRLNHSGCLMGMGLLAALFFSTTFLVNRALSLEGGHWFWSAALRYLYMILLLSVGIVLVQGRARLYALLGAFCRDVLFWILAGSLGFGGFYALLCFAADSAPGWVVATTWQLTIIASLLVLALFGRRLSWRTWGLCLLLVVGVTLVNLSYFDVGHLNGLALSMACIVLAAFCYPLGNQLVWEAQQGARCLPRLDPQLTGNAFAKVLLLSLGSLPFWFVLFVSLEVGAPSSGQWLSVAWVALSSGVIATSLFLAARQRADTPAKLAAVDASQSGEVVFALGGELLFLGVALPSGLGLCGLLLTLVGLVALVCCDQQPQSDHGSNEKSAVSAPA